MEIIMVMDALQHTQQAITGYLASHSGGILTLASPAEAAANLQKCEETIIKVQEQQEVQANKGQHHRGSCPLYSPSIPLL